MGEIHLQMKEFDPNAPGTGRVILYAKEDGLYIRRPGDALGIRLRLGMDDTVASALKNNGGDNMIYGEVVIWDITADGAVRKTNIRGDYRVAGVVNSDIIVPGNVGSVMTQAGQIVEVLCDAGAVQRGQFLIASSTRGRACAAGYYKSENAFAVALSEKAAGSEGLVQAMLVHGARTIIAGNSGWAVGGVDSANNNTTNAQRLIFASETWGSVASAALPTATRAQAGLGYSIYNGYAIGGTTTGLVATAYRIDFASDSITTVAGAALGTSRHYLRYGHNGPDKGWVAGGYTTAVVTTTDKIDFASGLRSAGANLTVADSYRTGTSDGTQIYSAGNAAPTNRIAVGTETISAATDANIALSQDYSALAFPVQAGYYFRGTSGAKISFATGVAGAVGGASGQHSKASGVADGIAIGYVAGNSASPFDVTERFNPATETFSSAGNMDVGKYLSAVFNNGAY